MIRDLKTEIWAQALIKRAEIGGASGYVIKKGDVDAGSVIVKISVSRDEAKILVPSRNMNGDLIFVDMTSQLKSKLTEGNTISRAIDEYIERRLKFDADLWVVEIEDVKGRDFMIERVE